MRNPKLPPVNSLWWEGGVRFECQGSGKCCASRGQYGYVYLTPKDARRLADGLKMTVSAFRKTHCGKTNGQLHLKNPDQDCGFLDGKRCSVYEARPEQCRTWPFWPENMDARVWSKDVAAFCPGVGKGRLYSAEEIKDCLRRDPVDPLKDSNP